jgi:hypothetical protein
MPSFSYIARTEDGTLAQGTIDAASATEAKTELQRKQLSVEELREGNRTSPLSFTPSSMPWQTTEEDVPASDNGAHATDRMVDMEYIPLLDTLRLFAGWLLAWYALVFLLGSFQQAGRISSDIPFLQALFSSSLVLRFAFATYLFLLLSSVHRRLQGGVLNGIFLTMIGIAGVALFWVYG